MVSTSRYRAEKKLACRNLRNRSCCLNSSCVADGVSEIRSRMDVGCGGASRYRPLISDRSAYVNALRYFSDGHRARSHGPRPFFSWPVTACGGPKAGDGPPSDPLESVTIGRYRAELGRRRAQALLRC